MKRPTRLKEKPAPSDKRDSAEIGLSITNQRGERYCCRTNGVSLRIKRGVVQMVEGKRGCFVWFERCQVEVRDGRRNVLFRLLTGSASSDGADLAIVAEVAGDIGGTLSGERSRRRLPRKPASRRAEITTAAGHRAHAEAA